MSELQGYVIQLETSRKIHEVSLLSSSEDAAIRRTRVTLFHCYRRIEFLQAHCTVLEVVSLEEFKAGRAAGTR